MPVEAPKSVEMPAIDYADHTVEIDTRGLFNAMAKLKAQAAEDAEVGMREDVEFDADLTSAQIHTLLNQGK